MAKHRIVSRAEWLTARRAHLAHEKEFTRQRDRLNAERRALPWVPVDKVYAFDGPDGRETLSDLFAGRRQLMTYHVMFGPGWREGCPGCSFLADHIDGANLHLAHHDVSLVAVSRAPWREFQPFRERMGWRFKWVSSANSGFNFDYGVSFTGNEEGPTYNYQARKEEGVGEAPGISVFFREPDGSIFHTYSSYGRGGDLLIGAYNYLDLAPLGRNEAGPTDWMRHHDKYAE